MLLTYLVDWNRTQTSSISCGEGRPKVKASARVPGEQVSARTFIDHDREHGLSSNVACEEGILKIYFKQPIYMLQILMVQREKEG